MATSARKRALALFTITAYADALAALYRRIGGD
jgi:hypothetical protein